MSLLTPAGQAAYQAVQWAFGDPASRVEQSQARVRELADQNPSGKEANEIADAATMLSRLSGTLHPQARTITDQAGGG